MSQKRITCPKCNKIQPQSTACRYCGVIFAKAKVKLPPIKQSFPQPGYTPPPAVSDQNRPKKIKYSCEEIRATSLLQGRLTAEKLEILINEKAFDGWELDKLLKTETRYFIFWKKEVVILVFKKEL